MNFFQKLLYLLRKYPVARLIAFVAIILTVIGFSFLITHCSRRLPQLNSISPQIANPGDVINIYGNHFGPKIDDSYVEINGNRITASHYLSWSEDNIQIQLPENIDDGLLFVHTSNGRSKPINFTNGKSVPIVMKNDSISTLPFISYVEEKNCSIGKLITITGRNFGSLRNDSKVFFSFASDQTEENDFITCDENRASYDFWSNQEIRIRIPDGTKSGDIYLSSEQGESNRYKIEINMPGVKQFSKKTTYLLTQKAEVQANDFKGNCTVVLRFSIPPETTSQHNIENPSTNPGPVTANFMNTKVFRTTLTSRQKSKFNVEVSYLIPVYSTFTSIDRNKIKPYSSETKKIFAEYLKEDEIIDSGNEDVQKLGKSLYEKYSNPYDTAKNIYRYITTEMELLNKIRGKVDASGIIASRSGDGYELTMLFCALCRNAGIPCVPLSGIYIDSRKITHNHWWAEFYIEEFGWVPVDVILGSGFTYPGIEEIENPSTFYFGNMDSRHVAFSRGWNRIQSTNFNYQTKSRTKTYALQSIWEESSANPKSYTATWNNIEVSGIY